jgi:hypothetical protein
MKNKLLSLAFLAFALPAVMPVASAQIGIGITIGRPPAPRVVAVRPVSPGPDFAWIDGYWYPVNGRYVWHDGYWSRPAYVGAHWVPARHDGHQFFAGYWDGPHGRVEHDHRWDRGHDRDFNHDHH